MDVRAILNDKGTSVISTTPNIALSEVAKLLNDEKIGAVLVLEKGEEIVGILSERDIVRAISQQGHQGLEGTVADAMTRDVMVCTPDSTLDVIISGMTKLRVRHLPVVEDGKLQGLISIGDVLKHRIKQLEMGEEQRFAHWFRKGRIYSLKE